MQIFDTLKLSTHEPYQLVRRGQKAYRNYAVFIHFQKFIRCFFCCFVSLISGIFAYLNYLTPKTRREILDLLVTGLKRLEYRGYDSAGVAIDSNDGHNMLLVKRSGKVLVLEEAIKKGTSINSLQSAICNLLFFIT